jgi:hypothetical protein
MFLDRLQEKQNFAEDYAENVIFKIISDLVYFL